MNNSTDRRSPEGETPDSRRNSSSQASATPAQHWAVADPTFAAKAIWRPHAHSLSRVPHRLDWQGGFSCFGEVIWADAGQQNGGITYLGSRISLFN